MTDEELKALVGRLRGPIHRPTFQAIVGGAPMTQPCLAYSHDDDQLHRESADAIEHLLRELDEKKRTYNELVEDVRAARSEAYEQGRESREAENARLRVLLTEARDYVSQPYPDAVERADFGQRIDAVLKGGQE